MARIADFGQFKYEIKKKDRQQKKQQKAGMIKGIRLTPRMGQHDVEVQVNKAKKFLEQRQKIRIEMILKGREKAHFDLAEQKIRDFIEQFKETKIEQGLKRQGSTLTAVIAPR